MKREQLETEIKNFLSDYENEMIEITQARNVDVVQSRISDLLREFYEYSQDDYFGR